MRVKCYICFMRNSAVHRYRGIASDVHVFLTARISRLTLRISCTKCQFSGGDGEQKTNAQWQHGGERCRSAIGRDNIVVVGGLLLGAINGRVVEHGCVEARKAQGDDVIMTSFVRSRRKPVRHVYHVRVVKLHLPTTSVIRFNFRVKQRIESIGNCTNIVE